MCKFGRNRAICLREKAILGRALKCPYYVTFDLDLDLEHNVDAAHLQTIVFKFGRNRTICLREKAILGRALKCPYHVTFDLKLDLEHTLNAGSPVDHRVQVCSVISVMKFI